jgi:hypothetical protein
MRCRRIGKLNPERNRYAGRENCDAGRSDDQAAKSEVRRAERSGILMSRKVDGFAMSGDRLRGILTQEKK